MTDSTTPKTQPASLYADPEMQQGVATVEVPAPFYPSLIEYQGDIYKNEPGYGPTGNYTKVTDLFKVPE